MNPEPILMAKTTKVPFEQALLDQIKAQLLEEKSKLEEELTQFTKPNPHVAGDFDTSYPEYGDDIEDNAQEVTDYLSNKPVEITLEKTLRDVKTALTRLDDGTYGICKYCDQAIDEKRLLARPTSSSCVSCKKTLTDEA